MLENSILIMSTAQILIEKVKEIQKVTNKEWLDNLEDRKPKN